MDLNDIRWWRGMDGSEWHGMVLGDGWICMAWDGVGGWMDVLSEPLLFNALQDRSSGSVMEAFEGKIC